MVCADLLCCVLDGDVWSAEFLLFHPSVDFRTDLVCKFDGFLIFSCVLSLGFHCSYHCKPLRHKIDDLERLV